MPIQPHDPQPQPQQPQPQQPPFQPPQPPKPSHRKRWIVAGVAALVLIGGGAGAFFGLHGSAKATGLGVVRCPNGVNGSCDDGKLFTPTPTPKPRPKPTPPAFRTVTIFVDDSSALKNGGTACDLNRDTFQLTDENGQVLGAAALVTPDANCQYTAPITHVPTNRKQYIVGETGVKGSVVRTHDEMVAESWRISVTYA